MWWPRGQWSGWYAFWRVVRATRHSPIVPEGIEVSPIALCTCPSPDMIAYRHLSPSIHLFISFSRLSPYLLASRRESSVKMESSALFQELPFHQWEFQNDYNCLFVYSRHSPPPIHIDAEGHLWTMYDDGSCWSNFAWNVVVYGTYDAFGNIAMHHVSGGVIDVRDAFS